MKWGKLRPSIPSRFLLEMRGDDERAKKVAEMAVAHLSGSPMGASRADDKNETRQEEVTATSKDGTVSDRCHSTSNRSSGKTVVSPKGSEVKKADAIKDGVVRRRKSTSTPAKTTTSSKPKAAPVKAVIIK
jgi:hypothetical protein